MTMSFYPTLRHVITLLGKSIRFHAFLDLNKNSFAITSNNFGYRVLKVTSLVIIFFYLSPIGLKGQEVSFPRRAIILDMGGIGGYGSLNYESTFYLKNKHLFSYRAGLSFFRFKDFERELNPDLLFPFSIQYNLKFNHHQTFLGIGQTISSIVKASSDFSTKVRKTRLNLSCIIGYRFQKENKPFFIQISYTPILEHYKAFQHWGGIGFGYTFFQKRRS